MKPLGIRARVITIALLPSMLISIMLSVVFLSGRFDDIDAALHLRGRALARQLASSSEFAIFAGNREELHTLTLATAREPDIRAAAILDLNGTTLALSGSPAVKNLLGVIRSTQEYVDESTASLVITVPVTRELATEDIYSDSVSDIGKDAEAKTVGYVVLEVSTVEQLQRTRFLLMIGIAVTMGGFLLGTLLALSLARGVTEPVLRIGDVVDRIGRGELSARVEIASPGTLRRLEIGVNDMAERIESAQRELIRKIEEATVELRLRRDEAEHATQAKSHFLASASHDLRQPMHALGMFVSRLTTRITDKADIELVKNIDASVQLLQDLLDSLLDISRLDAGALQPNARAFPISLLLARVCHDNETAALEKGLQLRAKMNSAWVMSDSVLIERIVMNFVSNAIHYTLKGGVLVACRRRGDCARVEVWDSGIGIPSSAHEAIFKEFVQLSNPGHERGNGFGLGLAICSRLASLLGHNIGVKSIPGRGSVFWIEIPITDAKPEGLATAPASIPNTSLEGVTIALVDDDEMARNSTRELLQSWDCQVVAAESGEAVLRSCEELNVIPQVAICDYHLHSGATGTEVAQRLRERYGQQIAVIIFSGDTNADLARSLAERQFPLLHKPVRPARLRSLLQRLLISEKSEDA